MDVRVRPLGLGALLDTIFTRLSPPQPLPPLPLPGTPVGASRCVGRCSRSTVARPRRAGRCVRSGGRRSGSPDSFATPCAGTRPRLRSRCRQRPSRAAASAVGCSTANVEEAGQVGISRVDAWVLSGNVAALALLRRVPVSCLSRPDGEVTELVCLLPGSHRVGADDGRRSSPTWPPEVTNPERPEGQDMSRIQSIDRAPHHPRPALTAAAAAAGHPFRSGRVSRRWGWSSGPPPPEPAFRQLSTWWRRPPCSPGPRTWPRWRVWPPGGRARRAGHGGVGQCAVAGVLRVDRAPVPRAATLRAVARAGAAHRPQPIFSSPPVTTWTSQFSRYWLTTSTLCSGAGSRQWAWAASSDRCCTEHDPPWTPRRSWSWFGCWRLGLKAWRPAVVALVALVVAVVAAPLRGGVGLLSGLVAGGTVGAVSE